MERERSIHAQAYLKGYPLCTTHCGYDERNRITEAIDETNPRCRYFSDRQYGTFDTEKWLVAAHPLKHELSGENDDAFQAASPCRLRMWLCYE